MNYRYSLFPYSLLFYPFISCGWVPPPGKLSLTSQPMAPAVCSSSDPTVAQLTLTCVRSAAPHVDILHLWRIWNYKLLKDKSHSLNVFMFWQGWAWKAVYTVDVRGALVLMESKRKGNKRGQVLIQQIFIAPLSWSRWRNSKQVNKR